MSAIKARLGKFETVDEFVEGYGQYFFRGGILLPTRHTREEGETIQLHLQISSGETVLRGEGVVKQVRLNAEGRTVGLVIHFRRLDARSKEIVDRIMDAKRELRASGELPAAGNATPRLRDTTTGQHLAVEDIGAIADAIDDTFDAIFGANAERVEATPEPEEEYLASLGGMAGFAVASTSGDDEGAEDEGADDEPSITADEEPTTERTAHDDDDTAERAPADAEAAPARSAPGDDADDVDGAEDADDEYAFPGRAAAGNTPPDSEAVARPAAGGTMMLRPSDLGLGAAQTELARPAAPIADDDAARLEPSEDVDAARREAESDAVLAALLGDGDGEDAEYRDEETAPPGEAQVPDAPPEEEPTSAAGHTMFGMPALQGTGDPSEGSQPLARLGITQVPSTSIAKKAPEPTAEADGEERVKSFISALTGGPSDDEQAAEAQRAETAEVAPAPATPVPEAPAPPPDVGFGATDVPAFDEEGSADASTPGEADDLRAAAERAAASAEEGEAALDELLADDDDHSDVPAALTSGFDAVPAPVEKKPEGLVGRFIAWLKGLFGG